LIVSEGCVDELGIEVGSALAVGFDDALAVGFDEGWLDGATLIEGLSLGMNEGCVDKLGKPLGIEVGSALAVGFDEGWLDGATLIEGLSLGTKVGLLRGLAVVGALVDSLVRGPAASGTSLVLGSILMTPLDAFPGRLAFSLFFATLRAFAPLPALAALPVFPALASLPDLPSLIALLAFELPESPAFDRNTLLSTLKDFPIALEDVLALIPFELTPEMTPAMMSTLVPNFMVVDDLIGESKRDWMIVCFRPLDC